LKVKFGLNRLAVGDLAHGSPARWLILTRLFTRNTATNSALDGGAMSRNSIYAVLGLALLAAELVKPKEEPPSHDKPQQKARQGQEAERRLLINFIEYMSFIGKWFAAFYGACVLASIGFIIAAYTSLTSVSDICVAAHFVAEAVKLGQSAAREFFMCGLLSIIAAAVGWRFRDSFAGVIWQRFLLGGQAILIVWAGIMFSFSTDLHAAFDRHWFTSDQIQERWSGFQKACAAAAQGAGGGV
jgi:hypothetical protein